jgi:dTDP-4-dehydrorhamnose reductase
MPVDVLVFGRFGQLARALAASRVPEAWRLSLCGREAIDLSHTEEIEPFIASRRPDAVINAAAYTAVDKAECNAAEAFSLNRDAPASMASACAARDIPIVHVSTDYVFDGAKSEPYVETDAKAPLNVYGRSKSEGEDRVITSGATACVIRTSWLYDATGANFVTAMLRVAHAQDEVRVVADQVGRPTSAADLAEVSTAMLARLLDGDAQARGVFHYAGAGDASWADFAEAIFAEGRVRGARSARVVRIATAEYPADAARPANSRLDSSKIGAIGIRPRPWREALALCLRDAPI